MSNVSPTVHAAKRRRTGHKPAPMVEGEDLSLDTLMYRTAESGTKVKKVLVPVRLDEHPVSVLPSEPDQIPDYNNTWSQAPDDGNVPGSPSRMRTKDRFFYMKEFVSRVDAIIEAMDDAEALPEPSQCAKCNGSAGQWLCNDCIGHHVLCRKCMRDSHFSNPLHRIRCWTGTHFHPAALWEVGVYLILPHHTMPYLCENLLWQQTTLENLQKSKDHQSDLSIHILQPTTLQSVPDQNHEQDDHNDAAVMKLLDELFAGNDPETQLEDDDLEDMDDSKEDIQDAEAGVEGFVDYMASPLSGSASDRLSLHTQAPITPNQDGLHNQYI